MADQKPPTRSQFAKFLPDAETIKAFEKLFELAGDTTPTTLQELEFLVNGLKTRIQSSIYRLAEIDNLQPQKVNLIGIEQRLGEIEIQVLRHPSYDALMKRIEDLEKLVGV
jgi:hypothetical protein